MEIVCLLWLFGLHTEADFEIAQVVAEADSGVLPFPVSGGIIR